MATVTCPACGADFLVDDPSVKFASCPFCGTKVAIAIPANKPRHSPSFQTEDDTPGYPKAYQILKEKLRQVLSHTA